MNIELARTFLEIVEAGSFIRAAEQLNVTQSTVSTRVREMEALLGRPLFTRSKAGVSMTAAGQHFHQHAATLVRVWQQARQEIALPANYRALLTIGAQFSLWDRLLLQWVGWMRVTAADVALRAEVGRPDDLMRQIVDGILNIGVMYTPRSRPGLQIEKLLNDNLVLASTRPDCVTTLETDYVYIDWGLEFRASHSLAFPKLETPAMRVGLGTLALGHILEFGGSGYFPIRLVRPFVEEGRLYIDHGAPVFQRPAFVVFPAGDKSDVMKTALEGLHAFAKQETSP
jgi:DNA-binding transcriptional LysR family regulator